MLILPEYGQTHMIPMSHNSIPCSQIFINSKACKTLAPSLDAEDIITTTSPQNKEYMILLYLLTSIYRNSILLSPWANSQIFINISRFALPFSIGVAERWRP